MGTVVELNNVLPITDDNRLVRLAKQLAWEMKPDAPLLDNPESIDHYWNSLHTPMKLRYASGVEVILMSCMRELEYEKAHLNAVRIWMEATLNH